MSVSKLEIDKFLADCHLGITIDSRSESEYLKAHIPGALNFPILNDEARKIVGTLYKQEGHNAAVIKGFELAGPNFANLIKEISRAAAGRPVYLYCWRGGMRSNILAWILDLAGLEVYLLQNGYKAFRHWAINVFNNPLNILILGGQTGSGKSEILYFIREKGEQVLDLESLAAHKGSAFGSLGMPPQPSIEHFENMLAMECFQLDPHKTVWIENESRQIGSVNIPENLFSQMRNAAVVEIQVSKKQRIDRIIRDYGSFPIEILEQKTSLVKKRLGPDRTQLAIEYLRKGDLEKWIEMLFLYYDKTYEYGLNSRESKPVLHIDSEHESQSDLAERIISESATLKNLVND